MSRTRLTMLLPPLVLLAACAAHLDLEGFREACLTAPADAAVELELEGDLLTVARVPTVPDSLPGVVREAAIERFPGQQTARSFREWRTDLRGWRLQMRNEVEAPGTGLELLLDDDGTVLEEVHPVAADRIPAETLDAATARSRLRILHASVVRSELRPNHWRFMCQDGAGRLHLVECTLTRPEVRIARIAHATATGW